MCHNSDAGLFTPFIVNYVRCTSNWDHQSHLYVTSNVCLFADVIDLFWPAYRIKCVSIRRLDYANSTPGNFNWSSRYIGLTLQAKIIVLLNVSVPRICIPLYKVQIVHEPGLSAQKVANSLDSEHAESDFTLWEFGGNRLFLSNYRSLLEMHSYICVSHSPTAPSSGIHKRFSWRKKSDYVDAFR